MSDELKISFLGDISLNGTYEDLYLKGESPFEEVSEVLNETIIVGNLECFARGNQGVNELKKPRLETSVDTLNYVKDFNLQIACLANNHVFDHLEDGFKKTTAFLDENGIKYLGASLDNDTYNEPLIIEEKGIKIGLLNYVTKDTNPNPPDRININLNWFDIDRAIIDIQKLKSKVHHTVITLHWGGRVEGGLYPDWNQPKLARQLIDAGADLIIGHHSHTVQPYEVYKGKYIFYSLGNFCFSDIYDNGDLYSRLSNRQEKGLIVQVVFDIKAYKVTKVNIKNQNGFIKTTNDSELKKNMNQFLFTLHKKEKLFWKLYYLKFKKINPIVNYIFVQRKSIFRAIKPSKIKKYLNKK